MKTLNQTALVAVTIAAGLMVGASATSATAAAGQCGRASWYALHSRTASGERMHRSYEGDGDPLKALAITTGPCELVKWDAETGAEVKRKDKPWWKGEFHLDGIQWIDYGSDPNAMAPPVSPLAQGMGA